MIDIYLHPNMDNEATEHAEEDVIVTNREGIIVKATKSSGRHYGLTTQDLIGRSVYELEKEKIFSPAITPLVLAQKKKVVVIQATPTGEKVLITGIPFFDEVGEVQFIISYSYEVSELLVIQEYMDELEREMKLAKRELRLLREEQLSMEPLILKSRTTQNAYRTAMKVAALDVAVTLYGEYGTGKTTFAKMIHKNSARKEAAFVEVSCETIPDALFEKEFFGTEKQPGLLALAHHGTLYLKGIDQLAPYAQTKLANILNKKEFTPIDSEVAQSFDVRLIASAETSLPLDLYYLFHIVPIELSPLRERKEDLSQLLSLQVLHYSTLHKSEKQFSKDVFNTLLAFEWEGNFLEVNQFIERCVIQSEASIITFDDLPAEYQIEKENKLEFEGQTLPAILERVEKNVLKNAQKRYRTTTEIAKQLGISQPSVVRKLKKYKTNQ